MGDGRPRDRQGTEAWLAAVHRHWAAHGFGLWAVTDRTSDELIGYCGLLRPGDDASEIEVAYGFARHVWGRGMATEAAGAALVVAVRDLGQRRLVGFADPDHAASQRVLEKLGLVSEEGHVMQPDGRCLVRWARAA